MELSGVTVATLGRPSCLPIERIADEIARRGGALTRRLTQADGVVVGYGARVRLATLETTLDAIQRRGQWCLSERGLLRALGLVGGTESDDSRRMGQDELLRHAGLARGALRLLVLFDVIDGDAESFAFRDLVAARQVRRLIEGGVGLGEIIDAVVVSRQRRPGDPILAHLRLSLSSDGELVRIFGSHIAESDGQFRLPLDDAGNPSLDALFEQGAAAEGLCRWREAEAIYRRILAIAPRDGIAAFNLGNALREQGRPGDAASCFERAVAHDPGLVEAWFNLAHLREGEGRPAAARHCLERALEANRRFADAMYNLARLWLHAGEPALAMPLYERYLTLDPASTWARTARLALRLCRINRSAAAMPPQG